MNTVCICCLTTRNTHHLRDLFVTVADAVSSRQSCAFACTAINSQEGRREAAAPSLLAHEHGSTTDTDTPGSRSLTTSIAFYSTFQLHAPHSTSDACNFPAITCKGMSRCTHITPQFQLHPAHPRAPTALVQLCAKKNALPLKPAESHKKICAVPGPSATDSHALYCVAKRLASPCSALTAVRRWPSLAACPCWAALSAPPTPQSARPLGQRLDHSRCNLLQPVFARRVYFFCKASRSMQHMLPKRLRQGPFSCPGPHPRLARPAHLCRRFSLHMLYRHRAASPAALLPHRTLSPAA